MKLIINGEEIQADLEGEKNGAEVVHFLHGWLANQGYRILSLSINGSSVENVADWSNCMVADIRDIVVEAEKLSVLRKQNLEVLASYAEGLHAALEGLSHGESTLPSVLDFIAQWKHAEPASIFLADDGLFSEQPSENAVLEEFKKTLANMKRSDGSFNTEQLPGFAAQSWALRIIVLDRLKEAYAPVQEAKSTGMLLEALVPKLADVSTQLLTGNAKLAFDTILRFAELMSKLLRLFWLMIEEHGASAVPFDAEQLKLWSKNSNQLFSDISGALENQDTVLLGDLLEYELPAHLEEFLKLINLIPEETYGQLN